MERVRKCRSCAREGKIIGHGLCPACYHRERRKKLALRRSNPDGGLIVRLDFQPMAHLLEEIRKRAGHELRDVNLQILWELSKSLGAGV
ncbi:MAG TPA: hypothetical protein PK250_16590 [Syntrophobacter fumaroxidans]|nr:hypothetical protein [Syntrophobacter fumaroxidans]